MPTRDQPIPYPPRSKRFAPWFLNFSVLVFSLVLLVEAHSAFATVSPCQQFWRTATDLTPPSLIRGQEIQSDFAVAVRALSEPSDATLLQAIQAFQDAAFHWVYEISKLTAGTADHLAGWRAVSQLVDTPARLFSELGIQIPRDSAFIKKFFRELPSLKKFFLDQANYRIAHSTSPPVYAILRHAPEKSLGARLVYLLSHLRIDRPPAQDKAHPVKYPRPEDKLKLREILADGTLSPLQPTSLSARDLILQFRPILEALSGLGKLEVPLSDFERFIENFYLLAQGDYVYQISSNHNGNPEETTAGATLKVRINK